MKRHLTETLERRKDAMIAALWSNSNYDDDKGTRKQAIEEIEANYDEAIDRIYGRMEEEAEIDKDNPFFAQMEKGMAKLEASRQDEGATVKDVVEQDYSRFIDQ